MTCERRTPGKITLVFSFRKSFHAFKPVLKPPEHFRECRILHILKREPMWFERSVPPHVVRNDICLIASCIICRIVEEVHRPNKLPVSYLKSSRDDTRRTVKASTLSIFKGDGHDRAIMTTSH